MTFTTTEQFGFLLPVCGSFSGFYPPRLSCVSASCFILVTAVVLPVFIAGRFPAASSPVWLQLMYGPVSTHVDSQRTYLSGVLS